MIQQVLEMTTMRPTLRAPVMGWNAEDPRGFVRGKPIGYTPGAGFYHMYDNVMAALADGWKLLAPPARSEAQGYEWGLVREVERD